MSILVKVGNTVITTIALRLRSPRKPISMTAFTNKVDRCEKKILLILGDHFHLYNHSKKSEYPFVCTLIKPTFSYFQIIG